MNRRGLLALSCLVLVTALVFGVLGVRSYLRVAVGYAAKVAGSAVFVAGRELDDVRREELRELDWVDVERRGHALVARAFGVSRRARWQPGLGVVLLPLADDDRDPPLDERGPSDRAQATGGRTPLPDGLTVDGDDVAPVDAAGSVEAGGPEDVGGPAEADGPVDAAPVRAVVDAVFAREAVAWERGDRRFRTRALLVLHEGRLVVERYAPGFGPDSVLPGWSMTKSVTNALVGILVRDGLLDLDRPAPVAVWSGAGRGPPAITPRHLLQMSSGLAFDETYTDPDADAVRMLFLEADTAGYAASRPVVAPPAAVFSYSSGTTNILSRLVGEAVGGGPRAVAQWMREQLFDPLEMSAARIEVDAAGTFVGSSFGHATARGWARFGQFYLDDGVSHGRRILPPGWVAFSVEPAPAATRGEYGAHFWLNRGGSGAGPPLASVPEDAFMARGFAGQLLAVIPSRRAVVLRLAADGLDAEVDRDGLLRDVLAALPD